MASQVTVRLRLMPVSLFTSLIAILITGGLLLWDQRGEARSGLARDAATQARIIAGNCSAALLFGDAGAAEEILASLREHPDVRTAAIFDREGVRLAVYRSAQFPAAIPPEHAGADGARFDSSSLEVVVPVESDGKRAGTVALQYDLGALAARLRRLALLVGAVGCGALAVAYLLLARLQDSITAPFRSVARLMEEVAHGDLRGSVRIAGGGELGRLGESITATIANLRDVIGRVDASFLLIERVAGDLAAVSSVISAGAGREQQVVETLTGATASLSATADRVSEETRVLQHSSEKNLASLLELSRSVAAVAQNAEGFAGAADRTTGAIDQMSASLAQVEERVAGVARLLQQTAAAMTEIDRAVGQVQELSSRTRTVAAGLSNLASEQGVGAMSRAQEGMAEISALIGSLGETVRGVGRRSEEIGEIVAIVGGIADGTALLALNAAILAAQAGEHGQGFAIVAGEMRKLAASTEAAIKQIAGHVEAIQRESLRAVEEVARGAQIVDAGARHVAGVGAIVEQFVAEAQQTNRLNEQIAAGADRQAEESARIAGALAELSGAAGQLLRSAGEQRLTATQILDIAASTGAKAALLRQSARDQLTAVTSLRTEAEGSAAIGKRLHGGADATRAAVGAVLDSSRVIEAAITENRSRAQALRAATDQLGEQSQAIRERLAVFRLGAGGGGGAPEPGIPPETISQPPVARTAGSTTECRGDRTPEAAEASLTVGRTLR